MVPLQLIPLLLAALLPAGLAHAGDPDAEEIFRRALERQGAIERDQIRDVHLRFTGQILESGNHAVTRDYWYRSSDRSFRVLTSSRAHSRSRADRGVMGADRFWERLKSGIVELSTGNREDRGSIEAIEKDRDEFERILRYVLLTRLRGEGTKLSLANSGAGPLGPDLPLEARQLLGEDRATDRYHALVVERAGDPRFVLYVHAGDYTVRKVVQCIAEEGEVTDWVYYFGPFRRMPDCLDLTLPEYFELHTAVPTAALPPEKTWKAAGRITLELNLGIAAETLRPG